MPVPMKCLVHGSKCLVPICNGKLRILYLFQISNFKLQISEFPDPRPQELPGAWFQVASAYL